MPKSGRGGRRGGTGGVSPAANTTSLVSAREGKKTEVDDVLRVLKDVKDRYGERITEAQIASMRGRASHALAYYDGGGNVAINKKFFDSKKMNDAYDDCVRSGFHPPRGNKSGIEAVVAHELGHKVTDVYAQQRGFGHWQLDRAADEIVRNAARTMGRPRDKASLDKFVANISGYAQQDYAEAVAEAFADVYCNGRRAKPESSAIVRQLERIRYNV